MVKHPCPPRSRNFSQLLLSRSTPTNLPRSCDASRDRLRRSRLTPRPCWRLPLKLGAFPLMGGNRRRRGLLLVCLVGWLCGGCVALLFACSCLACCWGWLWPGRCLGSFDYGPLANLMAWHPRTKLTTNLLRPLGGTTDLWQRRELLETFATAPRGTTDLWQRRELLETFATAPRGTTDLWQRRELLETFATAPRELHGLCLVALLAGRCPN